MASDKNWREEFEEFNRTTMMGKSNQTYEQYLEMILNGKEHHNGLLQKWLDEEKAKNKRNVVVLQDEYSGFPMIFYQGRAIFKQGNELVRFIKDLGFNVQVKIVDEVDAHEEWAREESKK